MVAHEVEPSAQRIAALRDAERLEEGLVIAIAGEDVGAVAPAVHRIAC